VEDKIQILFEGSAVKGVHLILLQISNTGNVPILPSDFLKDLTISFDGSTKILSAEITDKNPQSIDANLAISGTQLIISPSLWNSGDTITIKSLVSEFNESIQITGRIVGIKDIKLNSSGVMSSSTAVVVLLGMLLIFVGLSLISFNQQPIFSALIAIGYVLFFIPTFYDEKYRKYMSSLLKRTIATISPHS
jgi:hypothetical protein